jgi:hypothetical protein
MVEDALVCLEKVFIAGSGESKELIQEYREIIWDSNLLDCISDTLLRSNSTTVKQASFELLTTLVDFKWPQLQDCLFSHLPLLDFIKNSLCFQPLQRKAVILTHTFLVSCTSQAKCESFLFKIGLLERSAVILQESNSFQL